MVGMIESCQWLAFSIVMQEEGLCVVCRLVNLLVKAKTCAWQCIVAYACGIDSGCFYEVVIYV